MYLSRKYQVGGIAYTPYVSTPAGSIQESTTFSGGTQKSSSPEKISGTIKKEIIDILKENGLPSDVSVLLNKANDFLTKSQNLSNFSLFGGTNDDYSLTDLIKIQKMVNDVKYNNKLKEDAAKQVTSERAGSEIAITDNGLLYVQNEDGNIKRVSPNEYYENKDKYHVLTNNQLLYLREQDPGLAFKTDMLNDLRNVVGMKSITDYLKEQITAFGEDVKGGYATKDNPVARGMELLMQAGPDGYYKFTDKSQLRDVNAALQYLYDGMTPNAKNLLRAKTATDGGNPNSPKDVHSLILSALQIFPDREQKVDFDKSATDFDPLRTNKKGGSNPGDQLTQDNYLQQIGNMRLHKTTASIVPQASQVWESGAMIVDAYNAGAPVDKSLEVLGPMNLVEFRQKAAAAKAGDLNSISFGNRVLDPNEMPAVMYDGSSELNIAMLPYKHDPRTGKIMPDFEKLAAYNEIQRILKTNPYISQTELDQILQSKGIKLDADDYDRATNTIKIPDTMPFITFSAFASKDSIDISDKMKPFLAHLDNSEGKQIMDSYINALKYNTTTPAKNARIVNRHFNEPERWDMYRGNVYIPMENAARAMLLSGIGEYVPKSEMTDFAARVAARETEVEMARYLQGHDPNYNLISQNIGQF